MILMKTAFDNITSGDLFALLIGLFIFSIVMYYVMKAKR